MGAAGGVKINLFTDRILAAHRGTRKDKIAELPQQRKEYIDGDKADFKKKYGYDIPDLTKGPDHIYDQGEDFSTVKKWIQDNDHIYNWDVIRDIHHHNVDIQEYYKELRNREREERFIIKKSIPVKPEFMSIVIEKDPNDMDGFDKDFVNEVYRNYLTLLQRKEDVFVQNDNYRKFKNLLRDKIKSRGNK